MKNHTTLLLLAFTVCTLTAPAADKVSPIPVYS